MNDKKASEEAAAAAIGRSIQIDPVSDVPWRDVLSCSRTPVHMYMCTGSHMYVEIVYTGYV